MSSINTNVNSLIGSRIMNTNNNQLSKTLERLSTGYRINRGADDPAGLIASENLRSDMAGLKAAMSNAERASGMISTAEASLSEISDKLIELQGLTVQSASSGGLTQDEIDANQVQVDGIISSINRLASETSFQGKRLLNGSQGFTISGSLTGIADVRVHGAKMGAATKMSAIIDVVTAASAATAGITQASLAGDSAILEIAGTKGTMVFNFAASTTLVSMQAAVNAASGETGVYSSGASLLLYTADLGSDEFVQTKLLAGTMAGSGGARDTGTDAVVSVAGLKASVDGYNVSVRADNLDMEFTMTKAIAGAAAAPGNLYITGGGASFKLGPNAGTGEAVVGIQNMASHELGIQHHGYLSDISTGQSDNLTDDAAGAQTIVGAAIKQVAGLRGRLGSFLSDTVDSTMNSLAIAYENVAAAESAIRDTDFATETAALTRNQILVNASSSVLSIANSSPQSVLGLL